MSRVRFSSLPVALVMLVGSLLVIAAAPSQAIADRDCGDFATQRAAQKFFIKHGGPQRDPHGLDADHDGIACESNPCPCSTDTGGGGGGGGTGSTPPVKTTAGLVLVDSRAIAGEKVRLRATVKPRIKRQVVLQRKAGSRWVKVAAASTTNKGRHTFKQKTRKSSTTYRVLAPKAKRGSKTYRSDVSPGKKLRTQRQSVSLSMPNKAERDSSVKAVVDASPARPGRAIALQRRTNGGSWRTVDLGDESRRGKHTFTVDLPAEVTRVYRAVVRPTGGASAVRSDNERIVVEDTIAPPAPVVTATAGDGEVDLSWTASAADDLAGYLVEYGTTAGGWTSSVSVSAGVTSYSISGLENGVEHSFRVRAIDESGNRSNPSTVVTATPVDGTAPSVPTGLAATPADGSIMLSWTAVTDSDLAGYRLYVATSEEGPYALLSEDLLTTNSATVNDLVNGTTYWFKVSAEDESGNESAQSSAVSGTPAEPTPPRP